MDEQTVFIRADLDRTSTGNTAYYRLKPEMVDFLNKLEEQIGTIEGIILSRPEKGKIGFNIGFVCGKDKK